MRFRSHRLVWMTVACVALSALALAQEAQSPTDELTLERIMSDPDWLGRQPQRPFWADDSGAVYFLQKRQGSRLNDLFRSDLDGTLQQVEHQDRGVIDVDGGDLSTDGRKVYERQGDLYLKDLERGEIIQLTRTAERESSPLFLLGDRQITFMRGETVLVRDLTTGLEYQPADLRLTDDPDDEDDEDEADYLGDQQKRLFEIVRLDEERQEAREDEDRAEQEADLTRPPLPFYLGEKLQVRQASLSPDGRLMLVVLNKEKLDRGKRDSMPNYVTASGYVEHREVRSKVGTGEPTTDQLILLDLQTHERHALDLSVLPEIAGDPLAEVRQANEADDEESEEAPDKGDDALAEGDDEALKDAEDPEPRPVSIWNIEWTDDGTQAAFQAHSADNKDRWIATVDLETREVVPQHHLHDPAWINWRYNNFGWLPDGATLWYLSEETGYSHLYLKTLGQQPRELTSGEYEVSSPHVTRDGDAIFYVANDLHPGRYEIHRFNLRSGESERLTDLGGMNRFVLSPDEQSLLLTHSTTTRPADLWIQPATAGAEARQITFTVSEEFLGRTWIAPEIVPIPSAHHGRPIYSRVYDAVGRSPIEGSDKRPAVVFIHGAGYLQNAHQGWSGYFREYSRGSARWRRVAGSQQERRSRSYRHLWRFVRRLPDLHGDVHPAGPVRRRGVSAAGDRLGALQPRLHLEHPQHPVGRSRRLREELADRVRRRPREAAAHRPRHAGRQRLLPGFGAPGAAPHRAREERLGDGHLPDRAARLPRAVELARRISPHPPAVPGEPRVAFPRGSPGAAPIYFAKR